MYCKKCGSELKEDAVFCPKCGEKVDGAKAGHAEPGKESCAGAESGGKLGASGKSNKALIVAIALIVFLLLVIVAGGIFIIIKGREGTVDCDRDGRAEKDADSTIDGSGAVGENAGGDGETYTETKADVSVSVVGANEVGGLSGAEVILRNAEGETIAESETDSAGCASFEDVSSGGYTIACSADGYNARETELTVGATGNNAETSDSDGDGATNGDDSSDGVGVGTDIQIIVALAPVIVGDDACVLLVWEGDHDLDLCAFHSGLKEYVNIGHPVDSAGNIVLYADHGADQPYELLYIHDISDEVAKSFYVIEAANARSSAASGMEADGVSVYVYDASGLVYFTSADTGENAALWRPCYYYASSVYEEQQYISDATGEGYAWISFNEEDAFAADAGDGDGAAPAATDNGWRQAYLEKLEDYRQEWAWEYIGEADGYSSLSYTGITAYLNVWIISLDNDGIPDLYVEPWLDEQQAAKVSHAVNDVFVILSYQNGTVYEYKEFGTGGFWLGYFPAQGICASYTPDGYAGELFRCEKITENGFVDYNGTLNEDQFVVTGGPSHSRTLVGEKMTYEEAVTWLNNG